MTPEQQEFNQRFESVLQIYKLEKSCENAATVRKLVREFLVIGRRQGNPLALIGPSLGILDGIAEDHDHDFGFISKLWLRWMHRVLKPERPGWNDYWMSRWMVTGNIEALREIHRRANHLTEPWPMVQDTAQWMVSSYRQAHTDFDYQMSLVERNCQLCSTGRFA